MSDRITSIVCSARKPGRTATSLGLAVALFALVAVLGGAGEVAHAEADLCHRDCRAENAMCHRDARDARVECAASCEEDDVTCRAACRAEFIESRRLCSVDALGCRADCRDDLDPSCVDGCVDEFDACTSSAVGCAADCRAETAAALAECREIASGDTEFDGPGCVRQAIANGRECHRDCRIDHRCRADAKASLAECVLE